MKIKIGTSLALVSLGVISHAITLSPTDDLRLLSSDPSATDNNSGLSTYTLGSTNTQRTILKFDYSSLSGLAVTSAILRLYGVAFDQTSTAVTGIDVYRVKGTWSETQASWLNRLTSTPWNALGGDGLGTTGTQLSNPYFHWTGAQTITPAWYEFNVTNLVQGAVNGTYSNDGILLASSDDNNRLVFNSRENHFFGFPGFGNTPQLVVNSVPEPANFIGLVGALALIVKRRRKIEKRN